VDCKIEATDEGVLQRRKHWQDNDAYNYTRYATMRTFELLLNQLEMKYSGEAQAIQAYMEKMLGENDE
jgi:hypothetical protein